VARAPFQVLVIPYRLRNDGKYEFAVLQRSDNHEWQFIAGGGEGAEIPAEAAAREAWEEAAIPDSLHWMPLDAKESIPRTAFPGASHWPRNVYVVHEHCFGAEIAEHQIRLSPEHSCVEWLSFEQASSRLTWQSNRVALWELNERLRSP
jgi:dATP pyrophosphohydrolase